jgi:branched-chain amino acid transport system permease protein
METTNSKPNKQLQKRVTRLTPYIIIGLILIVLPPFLPLYAQDLVAKILVFAIFAMSLDIIYGYAGLWSFGHAIFFGVGGYTAAKLMVDYNIASFWVSAPCSIVIVGFIAAIVGFVALRTSGIYFLLITFALGQMFYSIAWKWKWLSRGGIEGIPGLSRPDIGIQGFTWSPLSFYYFIFVIFIISFILLHQLVNSPFGHILKGIRENEVRIRVLGFNTWAHKYIGFIIAGMFAGLSGVLFAYQNGIIVPSYLSASTSALAMLMVIVGGAGTLWGAPIGAAIILLVQYFASITIPERWPLILGAVFIVSAMYLSGGISLFLIRQWAKLTIRWKF